MILGFVTAAPLMIGLIFILARGGRKETAYYDVERQQVILEPDGLTLRGIGPIPWVDFGPAIHTMVPFWNRHHRYINVPGVEGLKPAEVMQVINTAHPMHSPITPPHPHHDRAEILHTRGQLHFLRCESRVSSRH